MLHRVRRFSWIDILIIVGLGGLLYGLIDVESQWTRPRRLAVEIDGATRDPLLAGAAEPIGRSESQLWLIRRAASVPISAGEDELHVQITLMSRHYD